MDGKQKNKLSSRFLNLKAAPIVVALLVLFLSSIFSLFLSNSSVYADGNCAVAGERQGSTSNPKAPDPNKCYKIDVTTGNATETANKPTGTASNGQGSGTDGTTDKKKDDDVTCAVEKVGWIVCPILESMAKISDNMFDVLANNFLATDVSLIRTTQAGNPNEDSGTKQAWEIARNLANIMFIIAFVVIILSQVTNMGINNYGIKKMLPRLVVAAIAVNVSYYICQIVVDLTNILGFEIQNALAGIANSIGPSVFGSASQYGSGFATGTDDGVLTVIIIAALASTAAVWLILGPGIAVITAAIITLLAIILILMLRKALIVLLIVVSPIAFVMYLLPNTEKYFSKWMRMFGQLLMVFPVVGLLFGAGQLASTVILVSGATTPPSNAASCDSDAPAGSDNANQNKTGSTTYAGKCDGYIEIQGTRAEPGNASVNLNKNGEKKGASWTLGLVAVGVAIAPLVAVYSVLKGALAAAGAIGGTLNTLAKRGSGSGSRLAGKLDKRRAENRQAAWQRRAARGLAGEGGIIAGAAGSYAARRARRQKRLELSKADLERQSQEYVAKNQGDLVKGLSSAGQQRAIANAQFTIEKVRADEIDAEAVMMKSTSREDLRNLAAGNGVKSEAQQIAAQKLVVEQGDYEGMNDVIDNVTRNGSREMRIALADALAKSSSRPSYVSQGAMSKIRTGETVSSEQLIQQSIENNTYAPEVMARTSKDELSILADHALHDQNISTEARQGFVNNAAKTLSDPQLARQLSKNRGVVEAVTSLDGAAVRNIRAGS